MYEEELFQDWLSERAEKFGKKINTERSVKMARNKLEEWGNIGYDCNAIIRHAIEVGWRGLWIPAGMVPKQKHLRPEGALKDLAKSVGKPIPKPETQAEKQRKADARREAGRARLAALRAVGLE